MITKQKRVKLITEERNLRLNRMRRLLYGLIVILIVSCKNGNKPDSNSEAISREQKKDSATNIPAHFKEKEINWNGFFAIQGKSSWFRKDKNSFCYTLVDETGKAEEEYKKSLFIPYSNETAKISFKGLLKFDGKDSIVVIKEINKIEQKIFKAKDFSFEYFLKGNETNWSLEILKNENVIAFKDFGTERSYLFNYKEPVKAIRTVTYNCSNEKDKLEILIEVKPCSDGMSDIKYDYTAKVTLKGKVFKGCGLSN